MAHGPLRRAVTAAVLVALANTVAIAPHAGASSERVPVIVQLHDERDLDAVVATEVRHGGRIRHVYRAVLTGFAADLSPARFDALAVNPAVASITRDAVAELAVTQTAAPWGLDRVDQRSRTLDSRYGYDTTGSGVTVYVIDTGIRTTHADLRGRAVNGTDITGANGVDCNGHGTHVAATVAGTTHGIAKAARIVSVRVFGDCGGFAAWSQIIAGLEWAVADRTGPSVANLSIVGPAFQPMDDAVARATAAGMVVVVAAGNDGVDSCTMSPARSPSAISVGATDRTDTRPPWSNWGACIDVFGPGVDIVSALATSDTATGTMTGTSMASPHVAGAVARHLQKSPAASPATIAGAIASTATKDVVADARSTNDHLVYLSPGARPDLVVTSISWSPATPVKGSAVRFSATVKNQGTAATPAGTLLGVAFKVNGTKVTWSNTHTSSLAVGASVTLTANAGGSSGSWTVLNAGSYSVLAQADDLARIEETEEANNTRTQTLTVATPKPDLVVTAISWSPATPVKGSAVRFSATVKNQGTAATPAGTVLGVAFKVNGTKVTWSDTRTTSLAAGASVVLTANAGGNAGTWTVPSTGSYTVLALVDDLARIAESVETNNSRTRTLTVAR